MDGLSLCISNAHEILTNESSNAIEKIHIFCDCRGAIESVTSNERILSHQNIKDEFIKHVTEISMKHIKTEISWVSGHADLEANEIADDEAKQAASILGYNYRSGEWYERSYKVFNKQYKAKKIDKEKEKRSTEVSEDFV